MNIGEEKEHIYSIMREITAERRELTEIYYNLKKRLDELTRLEERGLDTLSLKGYADLHNKMSRETSIANIKRESNKAVKIIEEESRVDEDVHSNRENLKKQIQKDKSESKPKRVSISFERMVSMVTNVLKEHGAPMKLDDLYNVINEKTNGAVGKKNFSNNIMYRMVNSSDNKIERAGRGYYQYRF